MKKKELIPGTFDPVFKAVLSDSNLRDYLSYLISEITDLDYNYVYNNVIIINGDINIDYINQKQYKTDLLINIENNKINIEANRKYSEGLIVKNNRYQHSIASDMKSGEKYNTNFIYQLILMNLIAL